MRRQVDAPAVLRQTVSDHLARYMCSLAGARGIEAPSGRGGESGAVRAAAAGPGGVCGGAGAVRPPRADGAAARGAGDGRRWLHAGSPHLAPHALYCGRSAWALAPSGSVVAPLHIWRFGRHQVARCVALRPRLPTVLAAGTAGPHGEGGLLRRGSPPAPAGAQCGARVRLSPRTAGDW